MRDTVRTLVSRTSLLTGAIAVVLSPVPLADELVFLPIFGFMASRIGNQHGLTLRDLPWRPIAATTVAALAARATVNVAVSYIPGVAAVANAASAFTMTRVLGRYVDGVCADPTAARALSIREIAGELKREMLRRREPGPGLNGGVPTAPLPRDGGRVV